MAQASALARACPAHTHSRALPWFINEIYVEQSKQIVLEEQSDLQLFYFAYAFPSEKFVCGAH